MAGCPQFNHLQISNFSMKTLDLVRSPSYMPGDCPIREFPMAATGIWASSPRTPPGPPPPPPPPGMPGGDLAGVCPSPPPPPLPPPPPPPPPYPGVPPVDAWVQVHVCVWVVNRFRAGACVEAMFVACAAVILKIAAIWATCSLVTSVGIKFNAWSIFVIGLLLDEFPLEEA
jgi:hypothetical protein